MSNGARQTQRAGRRKRRATCRAASGQHARSHARTGRQRCRAAPSLVKKMGCHIAGETWVPTARRERTDSTTKITSGSRSEGRGRAVPAPPAGEAGVGSNSMSAAAAWADARADRPEVAGQGEA